MIRRLVIAYRGTQYSGWQRQDNARTVQEVVEDALTELAGESITVVGASRTDAGVHARGQVAHLSGADHLPNRALVLGTTSLLPPDVRILEAERVRPDFHARKCALSKTYSYTMARVEVLSPLLSQFVVQIDPAVDVAAMQRASRHLVGEHDFTAFALSGGTHRSPRRRIFAAEVQSAGSEVQFRVVGDGFLRGMVRSIVGTLIELGSGRFPEEAFGALLAGAPRSAAGPTAPPQGLVLEEVAYDAGWVLGKRRGSAAAMLD